MAKFPMKPKLQTNPKIFKETQIMNERQNFKDHKILKRTQITNDNFKRTPDFQGNPNYK